MENRLMQRNLPQLLLSARDKLMSHFRPILNQFGLTEQQWRVLRALDAKGEIEQCDLCDLCQMHSASMAGVLARMQALDLVGRNRMATDQRRVLVRLSQHGEGLMGEITPLIETQYQLIEQAGGGPLLDELFTALNAFIQFQMPSAEPET